MINEALGEECEAMIIEANHRPMDIFKTSVPNCIAVGTFDNTSAVQ